MKKIISLLLTAVMLVSVIIIPADAVQGNAAIRYNGANITPDSTWFINSYCYINDQQFVKRVSDSSSPVYGGYDFTMIMDFKVEDYGVGADHFTDITWSFFDIGRFHVGYSFTHKAFVIYDMYMPGSDPANGYTMLAKTGYDLHLGWWYEFGMRAYDRTITLYINGVEMLVCDLEYLYTEVMSDNNFIDDWDWVAREQPYRFDSDYIFMTISDMDVVIDNISWYSGDYDIATGTASITYVDDGDFNGYIQGDDYYSNFGYWHHNEKFVKDPNAGTEKVGYNRGVAAEHTHVWARDYSNGAGCLNGGYDLYVCINGCGASEERNYTPALGHLPGTLIETVIPADDDNSGVEAVVCERCHDTYKRIVPLTDSSNGALHGYTSGGGCIFVSDMSPAAVDDGFVMELDLMHISNKNESIAGYTVDLGWASLGYDLSDDVYYIDIEGERVAQTQAGFIAYRWYRWDIVRDNLTVSLYVDNELVVTAELPEEIYDLYDEYNNYGEYVRPEDCYSALFTAPACEMLVDNVILASPDFDFAGMRTGVIYDSVDFDDADMYEDSSFYCGSDNGLIASIVYAEAMGAGYKLEDYGRPMEDVIALHSDRALLIDSDYEAGSMYSYSQLNYDLIDILKSSPVVDLEMTFDFYAFDWCTEDDILDGGSAFIGSHINSQGVGNANNPYGNGFAGYDFIRQQAVIGSVSEQAGGYYGESNTVFADYAVERDTWHNISIRYNTEFVDDRSYDNDFYVISVWMDGVKTLEKKIDYWSIDIEYLVFFPNFVKGCLDNLTVKMNGVAYDDDNDFTNGYGLTTGAMDFSGGLSWSMIEGGYLTHGYTATEYLPGCTTDHCIVYECLCGESEYSVLYETATGHVSDEGVITVEPSEGVHGKKVYSCINCGEVISGESIAADHYVVTETVYYPATCNAEGYERECCIYCGYVESETVIPATDHTAEYDWTIVTVPTETTEGLRVKYCLDCGEVAEEEIIPTFIYGDVNDDGRITLRDITALMRYAAKWNVTINKYAADVYFDGRINSMDAVRIAQYLAGWDVVLGQGTIVIG